MAQDKPFPNLGGLTFSEDVFYRLFDDLLAIGVVGATDYQVIQNHLGANMSVDVNPGSAYVAITNGGKRRTRLPAQSNSGTPGSPNAADNWLTTFTAADATNPRIDRVVLTVRDTSIDGSGASDSALRVIAGTPTSGATLVNLNGAAAVPANSILLANVLIPNAATTVITGNISDQRVTSKLGGNLSSGGASANLAQTVSGANTDLAAPPGASNYWVITTGGGTLRSIGAASAGAQLTIKNATTAFVTLKHALAGGTGAQLSIINAGDKFLAPGQTITLMYDGTSWVEVDRPGKELICDFVLGGAAASFDTNTILGGNIPAVYRHLELVVAESCSANSALQLRFNNDATASYDRAYVHDLTTNTVTGVDTAADTNIYVGVSSGGSYFGTLHQMISDYVSGHYKSAAGVHHGVQAGPGNMTMGAYGGSWRNAAVINRIQLIAGGNNFQTGSRFTLYGIT